MENEAEWKEGDAIAHPTHGMGVVIFNYEGIVTVDYPQEMVRGEQQVLEELGHTLLAIAPTDLLTEKL